MMMLRIFGSQCECGAFGDASALAGISGTGPMKHGKLRQARIHRGHMDNLWFSKGRLAAL
jgi:hypothetical protein